MNRFRGVAILALGLLAGAGAPASALSYRLAEFDTGSCKPSCPSVIVATGTIAGNEDEEFAWFMRHSTGGRTVGKLVMIHSPGGNMAGGMRLGLLLRRTGASVIVARGTGESISQKSGLASGVCGSACVLVLAGGAKRIVPQGSVVAVHGAAQVQTEVHDPVTRSVERLHLDRSEMTAMMAEYYARMGVSGRLAEISERVPQSDMRILTPKEMKQLKLVTTF